MVLTDMNNVASAGSRRHFPMIPIRYPCRRIDVLVATLHSELFHRMPSSECTPRWNSRHSVSIKLSSCGEMDIRQ
eukprot:scaffold615691_cov18-Prasinocladus_malaysianus.AAC.1